MNFDHLVYENIPEPEYVEYFVNCHVIRVPILTQTIPSIIYGQKPLVKKSENDEYLYRIGAQE